jgi:hypothetical protein
VIRAGWLLLLASASAWSDEGDAVLVAVLLDPSGARELRAPVATALPLNAEPAAVSVRIVEQGRAHPVVTRMLGGGPASIRVGWRTDTDEGETWIVAGTPAALGPVTVGFGDAATITVRKSSAAFLACSPACVPLLPGRATSLPGVALTLEDWLPSSEERHTGAPHPEGLRAARVEVSAPEGTRSEWLLLDDPASHLTLGSARLWVRTAR